jgi:hypothetical protein
MLSPELAFAIAWAAPELRVPALIDPTATDPAPALIAYPLVDYTAAPAPTPPPLAVALLVCVEAPAFAVDPAELLVPSANDL